MASPLDSAWGLFDEDSDSDDADQVPSAGAATALARVPEIFASWPPHYQGPCALAMGLAAVGGGRGFVAAEDLPAGALLLSESPFLAWGPAEKSAGANEGVDDAVLRTLLCGGYPGPISDRLKLMRKLHPVSLAHEHIPRDALAGFRAHYRARLVALLLAVRRHYEAKGIALPVSVLLCTVTYYANRAHNLARSP